MPLRIGMVVIYILLAHSPGHGQVDTALKKWTLSGYIKDLQTGILINNPRLFLATNLLHNRINFQWYYDANTSLRVDLRSRFFWGDEVQLTPNFLKSLDNPDDFIDFSWGFQDNRGFAGHTRVDRLYLEIYRSNLEIRIGKQRVNWGISTLWNPNDLFNAFSFTDFDYEERPGSDALRIRYFTGVSGSIELAMTAADHISKSVGALLWKFSVGTYDIQLLGGFRFEDYVGGIGWAGNIATASFKGEITYFEPMKSDGESALSGTLAVDYVFRSSIFTSSGFLYQSNGDTDIDVTQVLNFDLSAKNLYPYKYSFFSQWGYSFTPLLNGVVALIYSPSKSNPTFAVPTLTYSAAKNLDVDLIGQILFEKREKYGSPLQAIFIRIKLSY